MVAGDCSNDAISFAFSNTVGSLDVLAFADELR